MQKETADFGNDPVCLGDSGNRFSGAMVRDMMRDIVFLNVHRKYLDYIPSYGGFLGIYILSAWVNANGYTGQGFAGTLHQGRIIADNLCLRKQVEILGLYCDYANVTENIWLTRYVKERYGIPVILGGPQATSLGEDFLRQSGCDAIAFYEGELTVMELLNYFLDGAGSLADIRGIAYLDEHGVFHKNPLRGVIHNLDAIPFIDEDCYLIPRQDWSEISIITGRGCPFRCAFCHEGAGAKAVRYRSVDNVLQEIELCLKKMPPEHKRRILFTDDTFTLKPDRVKEICAGLKELRKTYSFFWFCEAHAGMLRRCPEMIRDLAEAGCSRIQLGIEAGTADVLKAYRKNITPDDIREVVARCRDAGIPQLFGNIIVGGALFSGEVFEEDLKFGEEILILGQGVLELGVVSYWPLPETELTRNAASYGIRIADPDFITTVDDFPQTENAEFDVWGINACVQRMRRKFNEVMVNMLRNRMIPEERMWQWIDSCGFTDLVSGYWQEALKAAPEVYAWYHLRADNEVITSDELSEPFESSRPIRVIGLNSYAEYQGPDRTMVLGHELTDRERDTLVLCTGRITAGEIAAEVNRRYPEDPGDGKPRPSVREIILKLEKLFLVAFARE
jgi:hypothetical protein